MLLSPTASLARCQLLDHGEDYAIGGNQPYACSPTRPDGSLHSPTFSYTATRYGRPGRYA